jgi:hypothetical protein
MVAALERMPERHRADNIIAMTRLASFHSPLCTAVLAGLGVAVVGLLIQFAGEPAKFGVFPPGIVFIVVAGLIVWLTRRWRVAPLAGVLIGIWITFGGVRSGLLMANLVSSNPLTVAGNIVMEVGLLGAAVTGIIAMIAPQLGSRLVGGPGRSSGRRMMKS